MQNENQQPNNGKPQRHRRKPLPPLTAEELELLKLKNFIDEIDIQRLFNISERTVYAWIEKGDLTPSCLGRKKFFDLQAIYKKLGRNGGGESN